MVRMARRSGATSTALLVAAALLVTLGWAAPTGAAGSDGPPSAVDLGSTRAGPVRTDIDVGGTTSCAIGGDGQAECWGESGVGALGVGPISGLTHPPRAVLTSSTPLAGRQIEEVQVGGYYFACALSTDGVAACWGFNGSGQVGDGTTANAYEPSGVNTTGTSLAGSAWAQISVGYNHVCGVTTAGVAACWGNNADGKLGNGGTASSSQPVRVATAGTVLAGKTVAQVAAGNNHSCALTTDGLMACWGSQNAGRLGNGVSSATVDVPTPVAVTTAGTPLAGETVESLDAGEGHTCALTEDGAIACWGGGGSGELGTDPASSSSVPRGPTTAGTPLAGRTITEVSAGGNRTCAVTDDGVGACWGLNTNGANGDGTVTGRKLPTALAVAGTPIEGQPLAHISTGDRHSCAVTVAGTAACWGTNGGRIGDGTTTSRPVPTGVLPRISVPTAPTGLTAVVGDRRVTLAWTPPTADGGSPITGYRIARYSPGFTPTIVSSAFSITGSTATVSSLINGRSYRFRVAAVTATGVGSWSALSAAVVPRPVYAPFASTSALVTRQFLDVIDRPPSSSELSQWVAAINAGTSTPGQLVDALRRSSENTTNVDPTARLYRALLGRAPDASGLTFWIERRRSGSWSLVRMADYFASSAEFKAKYGSLTNREFVTRIYTDVLGRPADTAGVTFWTAELDARRRTRGSVIVGFSESAEYKTKQRENTDASVAHILLLGRAPTATETSAWVTRQKAGVAHATLLQEILDSAAYAARVTA